MPSSKRNNDSNEIIHAMVVASQKVVDLMGKDLSSHFFKHKVSLVNVVPAQFYGPDAVSLVLEGKQDDIKKSLKQLKKVCYQREIGIECTPIKSVPPALKAYFTDIEDSKRFEKLYNFCSKEYLDHCIKNDIVPHPEVLESLGI